MLQAMNTGHDGSLRTAHANGPRHALWRLETMAMMSDVDLPGGAHPQPGGVGDRRDRAPRPATRRAPGRVRHLGGGGCPRRRAAGAAGLRLPAAGGGVGAVRGDGRGARDVGAPGRARRPGRPRAVRAGGGCVTSLLIAGGCLGLGWRSPARTVAAVVEPGPWNEPACRPRTDGRGTVAFAGSHRVDPSVPASRGARRLARGGGRRRPGRVRGGGRGAPDVLRRRAAARAALLEDQLAEAVSSLAAGLRAGLSVTRAIAFAAERGRQPLASSLAAIADRTDLGTPLDRALGEWAELTVGPDARLLAGVLDLHRRTGGELRAVLDGVAATLRERGPPPVRYGRSPPRLGSPARSSGCSRWASSCSSRWRPATTSRRRSIRRPVSRRSPSGSRCRAWRSCGSGRCSGWRRDARARTAGSGGGLLRRAHHRGLRHVTPAASPIDHHATGTPVTPADRRGGSDRRGRGPGMSGRSHARAVPRAAGRDRGVEGPGLHPRSGRSPPACPGRRGASPAPRSPRRRVLGRPVRVSSPYAAPLVRSGGRSPTSSGA